MERGAPFNYAPSSPGDFLSLVNRFAITSDAVTMKCMEHLSLVSIALEVVIAVLFVMAARKHAYFYGLALTFAIYVFYDLSRELSWSVSGELTSGLFFVATLSALYAAFSVYQKS